MPSLPELQSAFARAVIERDERALISWIRVGNGLDAEARIDVYRTNVLGNYRSALLEVYRLCSHWSERRSSTGQWTITLFAMPPALAT